MDFGGKRGDGGELWMILEMMVPCCSVCQTRYNEEERVPLLLQCGRVFCKECLSRICSSSLETTQACPRCRHVSVVGNSVHALRKNYDVLALLHSPSVVSAVPNFDFDYTGDEENEEEEERCSRGSHASISGGCGPLIELGIHREVKLVRKIGEGRRTGVETWAAVIGGGKCKHKVAVKRMDMGEDMEMDWVQGQLENLLRASM